MKTTDMVAELTGKIYAGQGSATGPYVASNVKMQLMGDGRIIRVAADGRRYVAATLARRITSGGLWAWMERNGIQPDLGQG